MDKTIRLAFNAPNPAVVEHLRDLLKQVEKGELRDYAYVTIGHNGVSDFCWNGERLVIIGALQQLIVRMASQSEEVSLPKPTS